MYIKSGYIRKITEYMSMLVHRIELSSLLEGMDISFFVEPIIGGILNRLYDWNLVYSGELPGVDLVDTEHRIAVQVTTMNTMAKVNHTLVRFQKNNLWDQFDRLIIFIISSRAVTPRMRNVSTEDGFSGERDIWNLSRLNEQIRSVDDLTRLKKIVDYLDSQLGTANSRFLPPIAPAASPSFIGREAEMEALAGMLENEKPVFISGMGGIGKTQLALKFAEQYGSAHPAYFLRYGTPPDEAEDAMRYTLLHADFPGYHFRGLDNATREAEYQERLDILREQPSDALLIIDGFDRPGRTISELMSERSYRDVISVGMKMIITTRSPVGQNSIRLGALDEAVLLQFMQAQMNETPADPQELLALIRAVDGHTLTVDLMARMMEDSWGEISPSDLLLALRSDSPEHEQSNDSGRNAMDQIYGQLKAVFDVSAMTEASREVLRCATLIPEEGMNALLFRGSLDARSRNALVDLVKQGWLTRENNKLTIHPTLRQVCIYELKPDDENCGAFLGRLHNGFDPEVDYDAEILRQLAQCFSLAAENLEDHDGVWAVAAGEHWREVGQTQLALRYFEMAKTIQDRNLPQDDPILACSDNNLGSVYYAMEDYRKALDHQLKAMTILEKNLPQDDRELAVSYSNIGYIYNSLGDHAKAMEFQRKALKMRDQVLPPDHPELAQSYHSLGTMYHEMGDLKTAQQYMEKALEIRAQILPADHPDLAASYENLGNNCDAMGDYEKALHYLKKALEIRNAVLPKDHPELANSYDNVGNAYDRLENYEKALYYRSMAMELRRENTALPPIKLAESYDSVSSTYGLLGMHREALEYQRRVLQIWQRSMPEDHPGFALVYNNLAFSYYNCGDVEHAVEYMEKAVEISKHMPPEDHADAQAICENYKYFLSLVCMA